MRDIFEIKNNFLEYKDVESKLIVGDISKISNPKVSIIMPVYNHPDYFELALKSAINQDYNEPYEIVVVDNDDAKEITRNQTVVENDYQSNILYYKNAKNISLNICRKVIGKEQHLDCSTRTFFCDSV